MKTKRHAIYGMPFCFHTVAARPESQPSLGSAKGAYSPGHTGDIPIY